ncbi:MAG: glycosyltransferase family 39 protein [Methylophilaceae bacterium]|nr:glycosyltransferase family 39 protein [Methylophilaceae bacterium]
MRNYISHVLQWLKEHRLDVFTIILLLGVAGITHGWNMFHYPYFENDEATYVSQAWSVIHQGSLAPYTYWYDHAPAGWIFMGIWFLMTGGAHLGGSLMNSGRIFMLVLHLASALLLYLIAVKLSKQRLPGIISVLIFSLSPLGIYFQRRILLDNIMIFWVLLALWLLINNTVRLRYVLASATCMGIAILSKENAIFFIPAFLYVMYARSHSRHRNHAIFIWLGLTASIVFFYFLYALLKNEFFPSGSFLGGNNPHVSLLASLKEQSGRGSFMWPWQHSSGFYINFQEWRSRDSILIYGGALATIAGLFLSVRNKGIRIITLFGILFWLFLARGKLVIDFYVVPIIPLLAMLIGSSITAIIGNLKNIYLRHCVIVIVIATIFIGYSNLGTQQYTHDEISNQLAAVSWIKSNVPQKSNIAMDDYAYPYLRQQDVNYYNADWVWKLQLDPSVSKKINYDWQNIEYILLTHEVLKQVHSGSFPYIKSALQHSTLVADYRNKSTSYIDIPNLISTNGDWAQVYKVKNRQQIILQDSWNNYKTTFIQSYGQVVDNNVTTSEGQAYGLLRAVQQNDQTTFDGILAWTKDHMQHRNTDKLFSWKWQNINGKWSQVDSNTATDADQDIAYALIQASSTWHDPKYLEEAKVLLTDIWDHELVKINGHYYVAASAAGEKSDGSVLVNPSYIDPAYYKIFAIVDKIHPWNTITNDSYSYLAKAQDTRSGLVPDWTRVDAIGNLVLVDTDNLSTNYGYDAFRTGARVLNDLPDQRAKNFLTPLSKFYTDQWTENKSIKAVYSTSGTIISTYGDIAQYGVAASIIDLTGSNSVAKDIYKSKVQNTYNAGAWGNNTNYYNQNWAAFTTNTTVGYHAYTHN